MKITRKNYFLCAFVLILAFAFVGCGTSAEVPVEPMSPVETMIPLEVEIPSKQDTIAFRDHHLYAAAYLGYGEMTDLDYYLENYLDEENVPMHYISEGEYYLIIPRYEDMRVRIYQSDIETMDSSLVYESENCEPFIIQCNISDIFTDALIELSNQDNYTEFSPYISLEDGSVKVGEYGLNITKN